MRGALVSVLVGASCVLGIVELQAPLATSLLKVKSREDVFALPPPTAIKIMSLGYDSAAADLVWAKLLLEYGTHWTEQKNFREAPRFIDDIIALDPRHQTLYQFVDTILVYQPTETNTSRGEEADARAARRYMEQGLEAMPYDGELWLHYGQFIAFICPAYLENRADIDQFRVDGAKAIVRAMELGVRVDRTMAAPYLLGRAGETKAAIAYLERAYALSDNPEEREQIEKQLAKYRDNQLDDERTRVLKTVESTWHASFPFLTRGQFLLLTPATNPAQCAGTNHQDEIDCFTSWAAIGERVAK